jgi:glycosyltransferase involved in cell wall biosynthesis
MKVSIITVALNNAEYIEACIQSVINQDYEDIEYIVIDGGSSDGTIDIIKKYEDKISVWVSEPDGGIYDAVNKGIQLATGNIVGLLHSDDLYMSGDVIETIAQVFTNKDIDSCYGDLVYVQRQNPLRILRYWKAGYFNKNKFKIGWMPPHPTFFVKRGIYNQYGLLNLKFPLAADYELMLRLLYKYNISVEYLPRVLVKMRTGGTSNPGLYTLKAIIENYNAWRINNLRPPLIAFLLKPLSKIFQYRIARCE